MQTEFTIFITYFGLLLSPQNLMSGCVCSDQNSTEVSRVESGRLNRAGRRGVLKVLAKEKTNKQVNFDGITPSPRARAQNLRIPQAHEPLANPLASSPRTINDELARRKFNQKLSDPQFMIYLTIRGVENPAALSPKVLEAFLTDFEILKEEGFKSGKIIEQK